VSRILIVDDEAILRDAMAEALRRAGHQADAFDAGRPALDQLARESYDLIVSDLRMAGLDGLGVLEEARRLAPDVPFIMVTAHGTVETAVGAMKKGAYDFIIKPFKLDARWSTVRSRSRTRSCGRAWARRRRRSGGSRPSRSSRSWSAPRRATRRC
jgi:two-component system nitrogen regulation response regulator NtrX